MLRAAIAPIFALAVAASATFAIAADEQEGTDESKNTTSTGMGAVCWTAMIEFVSHVGKRCVDNESAEVRAELDRSTAALRQLLLTEGGADQEQLQAFLDRQAKHAVPDEQLCASDEARRFYEDFTSSDPAVLAETTDEVLALDGPPIWGTCL